jgi:WD40 repeat protein
MPDGKTLITCSSDSTIRQFDLITGKEKPAPRGAFANRVMSHLSPDGKTVVTLDTSSRLQVWETNTGKWLANVTLEGEFAGLPAQFSPDGKYFLAFQREAAQRKENAFVAIDTATWKISKQLKLPDDPAFIIAMQFVDAEKVLLGGHDRCMLCDLQAQKLLWKTTDQLTALAVRPDTRAFAIATANGVSIRKMQDGKEQLFIRTEPNPDSNTPFPIRVDSLAFSANGKMLAASRWDTGDVYVWNSRTGEEIWRLKGHAEPNLYAVRIGDSVVSYSPDGHWLASGHNDCAIRLWEMNTGKEVRRFIGHDAHVTSLQFSPDGRNLVSAAGVEALQWSVPTSADSKADLDSLWKALASEDAAAGYRAMWSLAGRGKSGIEFLESKIAPIPKVDKATVAKMIADLDSEEFATRDKATRWLVLVRSSRGRSKRR